MGKFSNSMISQTWDRTVRLIENMAIFPNSTFNRNSTYNRELIVLPILLTNDKRDTPNMDVIELESLLDVGFKMFE